MISDLDDPSGRDPVRVGSKAAALAVARAAGAAVLPGFVVDADVSSAHLRLGAKTLSERGSGGARLAVAGEPLPFADDLVAAGAALGESLVARSSTLLEASGEWSGAFTSYVGISPGELPKAVAGCWASVFTVAALERQEAAGIEPGSFPMAVLVQPALEPAAGGWAQIDATGKVVVYGTKGSPAPLLQGWESGHEAYHDAEWSGDELIELIGSHHLDEIQHLMSTVNAAAGANRCEWALTDRIWALQLGRAAPEVPTHSTPTLPDTGELLDAVRAVVLAPGVLGEEMVLPWAIGGISDEIDPVGPPVSVQRVRNMARELTEEVWGLPWPHASAAANRLMAELRGEDPLQVVARLRMLRPPDPEKASRLLSSLLAARIEMVERGVVAEEQAAWHLGFDEIESALDGVSIPVAPPRLGISRWEPLVASVILSSVSPLRGTAASPGIGAGRRSEVEDSHQRHPGRRRVVTSSRPVPNLAALIWDASGLVTASGSPAAHLFEAARALRVPAVCGVDLGAPGHQVVAVDGTAGAVAILDLGRSL
ncbi:MAG TPA: PEP-utilizing enzyme [Acidimicrobiia bacterium]|nr:PEP-utilizing enzyme [Acidimicrobiia bacterium]